MLQDEIGECGRNGSMYYIPKLENSIKATISTSIDSSCLSSSYTKELSRIIDLVGNDV